MIHLWSFVSRRIAKSNLMRCCSSLAGNELEVPPFCDLHIDLPYNVQLKPLNVHEYPNCNKLIFEFDKSCRDTLEYELNGKRVIIVDKSGSNDANALCRIKAPIKANLFVKAKKDIRVGYFQGDKLHLESDQGNISVNKFQGNAVDLRTYNGDINLGEFVQADAIKATIFNTGDINTGRLQSSNLNLKTYQGNISVESSYCHKSNFEIEHGNLTLHNAHKFCAIVVKKGNINLTGFDGELTTILNKGCADIHLSKITGNSQINILNGALNLKLAEDCQDYVQIKLYTKEWYLADSVKLKTRNNSDGSILLSPFDNEKTTLVVSCMEGPVHVDSASWMDMIKLKLKNNIQNEK